MAGEATGQDEQRNPFADRRPGEPWELEDAAAFLHVHARTLRRGHDRGKVRLIRFGRKVLMPDSELRRLCEEGLA